MLDYRFIKSVITLLIGVGVFCFAGDIFYYESFESSSIASDYGLIGIGSPNVVDSSVATAFHGEQSIGKDAGLWSMFMYPESDIPTNIDYRVDCWINLDAANVGRPILALYNSNGYIMLAIDQTSTGTTRKIMYRLNSATFTNHGNYDGIDLSGGWHRLSFIRSGQIYMLYYDDVMLITTSVIGGGVNYLGIGQMWVSYGAVYYDSISIARYEPQNTFIKNPFPLNSEAGVNNSILAWEVEHSNPEYIGQYYDVYLDNNLQFTNVATPGKVQITDGCIRYVYEIQSNLDSGRYYWRVVADFCGRESEVFMFDYSAYSPLYPQDDLSNVELTPVLNWRVADFIASSVDYYELYFGVDGEMFYYGSYSGTETGMLNFLQPSTVYNWQIKSYTSTGEMIAQSPVWSFTTSYYAVTRPSIYKFDVRFANSWLRDEQYDLHHTLVSIQGLVNREVPRVFLIFDAQDEIWLNRLVEPGGLCEGWNIHTISDTLDYINFFSEYIEGVVLYDSSPDSGVISTSLVATSVAAAEGCIALRNATSSSIYQMLVADQSGRQLPIVKDLSNKFAGHGTIWQTNVSSTGSAKCDAYIWLIENYIKTGKLDTTKIVYTMDMWGMNTSVQHRHTQLRNLDYAFRNKAVCFELSPWADEIPNDDPGQPLGTDYNTFIAILDACNHNNNYSEMIKFCGFTNWVYKYTDYVGGKHGAVATEWQTVLLTSAYNAYMEADALELSYVSNTSFYEGLKPVMDSRRYIQNPPPSYQSLVDKGYIRSDGTVAPNNYILIYMGDYDQASWILYWLAGDRYDDEARGNVPCNWGLTPNSADRVGVAFDYMYRNKSDKDFFFAANSGAGYINPSQLYGNRLSGYSDALDIWNAHCRRYYRMFDYSITGWVLNGSAGTLSVADSDAYISFSGDGVGFYDGPGSPFLRDNVPVIRRNVGGPTNENYSPSSLNLTSGSGVKFSWFRTVLLYPEKLDLLKQQCIAIGNDYKFLDAYTFYYLLRYYLGGNNNYRATWVADNVPNIMATGQQYSVSISVRNDGWNNWTRSNGYKLGYAIVPKGQKPVYSDYDKNGRFLLASDSSISTGDSFIFDVSVVAPSSQGEYDLYYDLVREGVAWFRQKGNIEWKTPIIVADDVYSIDSDGDGIPDIVELEYGLLPWYPYDGRCGDIGFMAADISGIMGISDCYVDHYDLAKLASQWLSTGGAGGTVNLDEYAVLGANWLSCNDPLNIECWYNFE